MKSGIVGNLTSYLDEVNIPLVKPKLGTFSKKYPNVIQLLFVLLVVILLIYVKFILKILHYK